MTCAIALALGQIEEAMGLLDGRWDERHGYIDPENAVNAYRALVRARDLLVEAVGVALATVRDAPITAEEVERAEL